MTGHNTMRTNLVKMLADVQSYSFGAVLSNIEYKDTLSKAGFLLARIFQILSSEALQNYSVASHDIAFENSYLFLKQEVHEFIASIKVSALSVTENGFEKWDEDSGNIFAMFKFSVQNENDIAIEKQQEFDYE